jgi:hypothetical protein
MMYVYGGLEDASDASSNFHNSIPEQDFCNFVLNSANQECLGEK